MIPGYPVLWVIFFVLIMAIVLDRLLFRPFMRVIAEREQRVKSAIELANRSAEQARAATAEFTERTTTAQTEVYRHMDEARRRALEHRQEVLAATRQEVESSIDAARARLAEQASVARTELAREAESLASVVASRVLGRRVS